MKTNKNIKYVLITIIHLLLFNKVYSQDVWKILGKAGFSPEARLTAICLDSKGIPYVVFQEFDQTFYEITVMKYNGSIWETVGQPKFSQGTGHTPGIAIGKNDTPYVVFRDGPKAVVMKYNGTDWVSVGESSSPNLIRNTTIAIDKNGIPYIGFNEVSDSSKASVMKYDGNSWVVVGKRGFSKGSAGEPKLVLGQNDTPYMVYQDGSIGEKITVMKFNGMNWTPLGNVGFSTGFAGDPSIAINSKGQVIVAYIDASNNSKATVMEFKDSNWSLMGSAIVECFEVSLAIGEKDTPYLAFNNTANQKANVVKYKGTEWINVGDNDFSPGKVSNISIKLGKNEKPYIVFLDESFANFIDRISVMSYDNQTSLKSIQFIKDPLLIYPNPAKDFTQVSFNSGESVLGFITIVNTIGQVVKTQTIQTYTGNSNYIVDLENIEPGIYLIKVQFGMQIRIAKLIVE